jgi:hypothetical protein
VIPNIGPRGQAQRRRFGFVALLVAAALVAVLFATQAPSALRLVAFVPLWLSALGFFQARDKT